MTQLFKQAFRFGIVGILAMATHFLLVVTFVNLSLSPPIANIIAFLGAFQISYWGHASWSFQDHAGSHHGFVSLRRFFIVAIGGFSLNELLFILLLEYTQLPYQIALLLVLGFIAGITFLASRHWAFKKRVISQPPEIEPTEKSL